MTDKIEIQGKTVDEAVSEALLKMGARRDEVDITVLEEPKSGFLGLLGGRPARVVVRKRRRSSGGRRDFRKNDNGHTAHSLDGGEGGRGRQGGRRSAARTGGGESGRNEARPDTRRGAGSDGRRDAQRSEDKQQRDGSSNRRRRRGGRGRGRGRSNENHEYVQAAQDSPDTNRTEQGEGGRRDARQDTRRGGRQDGRRDNRRDDQRQEAGQQREGSSRRRRGRRGGRGRGRGRGRDDQRQNVGGQPLTNDQPLNDLPEETFTAPPVLESELPQEEPRMPETAARIEQPVAAEEKRAERPAARVEHSEMNDAPMEGSHMGPDEEIMSGIEAKRYSTPLGDEGGFETQDEMLNKLATGMLVRAGFPCRCQVVPDEYSLVKIVTDDSSAGMLIGRHGQTVDAVEHLVERMAHTVAGERVFMNLDINNYRLRREETLQDRAIDAIASVRNTGEEFHMEPMGARERRIVHLEAEAAGLHTRTEPGEGGKHVVISAVPAVANEDESAPRGEEVAVAEEAVEAVETPAVEETVKEEPRVEAAPEEEPVSESVAEPMEEPTVEPESETDEKPRTES